MRISIEKDICIAKGVQGSDPYSRKIETGAGEMVEVRVFGQLTRERIKEMYQEIDVVVCCSLEETMCKVCMKR